VYKRQIEYITRIDIAMHSSISRWEVSNDQRVKVLKTTDLTMATSATETLCPATQSARVQIQEVSLNPSIGIQFSLLQVHRWRSLRLTLPQPAQRMTSGNAERAARFHLSA